MSKTIRIGTRESPLATWQAEQVMNLLHKEKHPAELVFIKSDGDIDQHTPLYEMGVQGIFTKSLDSALLQHKIDLAVHSMKDVPTRLAVGLEQMAVLERGPVHDLLVFKNENEEKKFKLNAEDPHYSFTLATSSLRRKAQWLHRYPHHTITSLRGNIGTRLQKLQNEDWNAALFAQAGLERINLRPLHSHVLDWLLPSPAQGAIMVVGRENDALLKKACTSFNHHPTDICTRIERDFLRELLGGCSAPIAALAEWKTDSILLKGNMLSVEGDAIVSIEKEINPAEFAAAGQEAARELLANGGQKIIDQIRLSE